MYLKTSSAKWQPFCPGGDELIKQIDFLFKQSQQMSPISVTGILQSIQFSLSYVMIMQ